MDKIKITVRAYDPRRGKSTHYTTYVSKLVTQTGREDQFRHAVEHAHTFKDGLAAALAPKDIHLDIVSVETNALGSGSVEIDGVTIFEFARQAKPEEDAA